MSKKESVVDRIGAELDAKELAKAEKKKSFEKAKYVFVAIILVIEFIVLCYQAYNRFVPNMRYDNAMTLIENKEYKEASDILEKLGDYKNSKYHCNEIYKEYPQYAIDNAYIGQEVTLGAYHHGDIVWNVIKKTDEEVILLSKYVIDGKPYKTADFNIVEWLKKDFKNEAFANVKNTKAIGDVYILSDDEIDIYVENQSFAATELTEYAKSQGITKAYNGEYLWWTSDPFNDMHGLASMKGYASTMSGDNDNVNGVRPAVKISIK